MGPEAAGHTSDLFGNLKAAKRLPSPPGAALRVLELCRQDDADMREISRVIASDPVLAGRLLKFANSPLAGIAREVTSIREALLLLGLRTVKLTALGFSVASPGQDSRCPGFDLKIFWAASCMRAAIARWLAPRFPEVDREEAFTVALLAGLGQLALAQGLGEKYALVLAEVKKGVQLLQAEREMLGSDHIQIGAMLLKEWGLPEILVQAVAGQGHKLPDDQGGTQVERLAQVLRQANELLPVIAATAGNAGQVDDNATQFARNTLGCDEAAWTDISAKIIEQFREMAALFDVELNDPTAVLELYSEAQEEATRVGMVAQLERARAVQDKESLLRRATTDPLTGIANRAKFDEVMIQEVAGVRRGHGHFALLLLDIDHFKLVNDTYGHQVGDIVLKRVATAVHNVLREVDMVARYGGEEFAVVAPHTDRQGACVIAARIQKCLEDLWIDVEGTRLSVTISSGLTVTSDYPELSGVEQLIADADKQMYLSKNAGRNTWSYRGRTASKLAGGAAETRAPAIA
jgi:diguanylate cyclase (GGDEF)-like protein